MRKIDTLLYPRWIVPIEPDNAVWQNQALAIDQGRIVDILPAPEAKTAYLANESFDLPDHVVMPGLINGHTHSAMSLLRGLADDLPLMTWLNDYIWPAEKTWLSAEFVKDGSELAIAEMLLGGTTCFNDHYYFQNKTIEVALKAGIRACIGLITLQFSNAWAQTETEFLDKATQVYQEYSDHDLIHFALAPHSPYANSDETLKRVITLAETFDLSIHMHIHETQDEVDQHIAKYHKRPLAHLHDLGLLSPRLIAVHMTQLTKDEIELVKTTHTNVVHCPEANMKLASGICPVQALLDAGINVGIGTDGAVSNNDLDMLGEMRSAALLAKVYTKNPKALDATTVLRMATLNNAKALGLDKEIGSIKIGKSADIIAVNIANLSTVPIYHPISQLVYAVNRQQITDVWVAGKQLVQNRKLMTLDQNNIIKNSKMWGEKIANATTY